MVLAEVKDRAGQGRAGQEGGRGSPGEGHMAHGWLCSHPPPEEVS